MSTSEDSREFPRVNVSWRARVLISPTAFIECKAINISEQGVALLTDRAFPAGGLLTIALAAPDIHDRGQICPITLQARTIFLVASGPQFKIGAQITTIPAEGRKLLQQWVRYYTA